MNIINYYLFINIGKPLPKKKKRWNRRRIIEADTTDYKRYRASVLIACVLGVATLFGGAAFEKNPLGCAVVVFIAALLIPLQLRQLYIQSFYVLPSAKLGDELLNTQSQTDNLPIASAIILIGFFFSLGTVLYSIGLG